MFFTGGALSLDDRYGKNIVFRNVEVHYSDRQLTLEDVIFINCTFVIDNGEAGQKLGADLLTSSPIVNFRNSA